MYDDSEEKRWALGVWSIRLEEIVSGRSQPALGWSMGRGSRNDQQL